MKRSTKVTIAVLFFIVQALVTGFAFKLSAEAKVKYTSNSVPVVAVDYCSRAARNMNANYIEFLNYDFKPLDNESPEYYIILLDDTYFVTTNSKVYTTVLAAIHNKKYDNFFRSMLKCFIMDGTYGSWNELGYIEYDTVFGLTFVPNKSMLQPCWKNKKNRYFFGR